MPTMLWGADNGGGGCAWVGTRGVWEHPGPSAEFCWECQSALKRIIKSIKIMHVPEDLIK